ncbi:DNA helicase PcrA [Velocimicrobium porci]|uniref:ATP-dependent DNA helicase n=1 Tax=Velocimicrobium porci TaxID=2606634 RepID=A0A6L5XUK6_9FIRM|nr:DNA helicase PcrA [Velocimicrobium porci]MSS62289.1 DNA helicase PcrA [Velocimicrobium porci]
MNILEGLNKEQKEAVMHNKGPLLILAGAGSGKTRVLTHRIAYLIDQCDVNPWNILALTFTNKAAKEMRERVDRIVGYGSENIWVSTFHSTCVRILRRYIEAIGYDRSFTIYDSDDQKTLMRDICKYLNIDTKYTKERTLLSVISSAKDELITPETFMKNAQGDFNQERYANVYMEYQKRLKANNALDFDDLIFKTIELFEKNPEILSNYQNRFKYIMVDEYQDTNTAQFHLISLLASTENEYGEIEHNLCVVGDDDQSIYKFRGANIHNILNFEKEYPKTRVIKLEQNYRSTKNILKAANEVIKHNIERKEKALWTDNEEGEPIAFTQFDTEYAEAEAIVNDIYHATQEEGCAFQDFAILYRTNAQSRIFEEKLVRKNIPYKIVGAVNFYARKEIKDLLAYLKTIDNGLDDIAVKRIINVPRRGIGLTTIDRVSQYAADNNMSFYNALRHANSIPGIGRSLAKIESFVSMIEILKGKISEPDYSIEDLINEIIEATGYVAELEAEETVEAESRIENIEELINKIIAFESAAEEAPTLSAFLEEVALVADIDNLEDSTNVVVLMTLHSAKGLEFPFVYLCGMEDGIFPSYMTLTSDDPTELEEERRLCYVGITRAKKKLSLSAARQRMVRGETNFNKPSCFINEIPRYLLKQTTESLSPKFPKNTSTLGNKPNLPTGRHLAPTHDSGIFGNHPFIQKGFGNRNLEPTMFEKEKPKKVTPTALKGTPHYKPGDTVYHSRFGEGVVLDLQPLSNDYEVTVAFQNSGTKKMRSSFAKLKTVTK